MYWIMMILIGFGGALLGGAAVVHWLLTDAPCPRCHQRDWSKGLEPWRCRRCGASYQALAEHHRHHHA
jgi:tRNA(Ile2) C34 agmatinyltransferase TiaS